LHGGTLHHEKLPQQKTGTIIGDLTQDKYVEGKVENGEYVQGMIVEVLWLKSVVQSTV